MAEHGNGLSAFWIQLRHANFSPGLQQVEAGKGCSQDVGHSSAFWREDKRPCIIQRELSAAPVLPGITCSSRVHLCAHWKIFISETNFAW